MFESRGSSAATVHLTSTCKTVTYVDIDDPLLSKTNPIEGSLHYMAPLLRSMQRLDLASLLFQT